MKQSLCRLFVLFCFFALGLDSASHAKTVEEIFAEVNKLSPAERQKKLEDGARAEGNLKFYSNSNNELLELYAQGFMKKYPYIKAEYWRGSGTKLIVRALLEHRTGKLNADVVAVGAEHAMSIMKAGIWARYHSPESKAYSKSYYDEQGYWYADHLGLATIAYNTRMVKPDEAPKAYSDLLHPRWHGALSIDLEPERAVMGWLVAWGEEKTRDFLIKLMRNGTQVRRGHTLQLQLLCAGEFKIGTELYPDAVARFRRQNNCPANIVFPNPTPGHPGTIMGVYPSAPHPHAAALFVDFLLSPAGAKLLASTGRIPARKGIKSIYEELSDLEEKAVPLLIVSPEKAGELGPVLKRVVEETLLKQAPH